jgi:hypothetical protein
MGMSPSFLVCPHVLSSKIVKKISTKLRVLCSALKGWRTSRWLPTAAARVRARVWSSGIYGGQSGAGAGFLRVLWFPLPIFIPPNSPSS